VSADSACSRLKAASAPRPATRARGVRRRAPSCSRRRRSTRGAPARSHPRTTHWLARGNPPVAPRRSRRPGTQADVRQRPREGPHDRQPAQWFGREQLDRVESALGQHHDLAGRGCAWNRGNGCAHQCIGKRKRRAHGGDELGAGILRGEQLPIAEHRAGADGDRGTSRRMTPIASSAAGERSVTSIATSPPSASARAMATALVLSATVTTGITPAVRSSSDAAESFMRHQGSSAASAACHCRNVGAGRGRPG